MAALLRAGETLIMEARAREVRQGSGKGTLTLTNKAFIFESVKGILAKKKETEFSVAVSSIRSVGVEGLFSKKLVVEVNWSGNLRKYEFEIEKARDWEAAVRSAVQQV